MDRILLVDDHSDIRRLVRITLGKSFEVLEAEDGSTALEIVRTQKPRLVEVELLESIADDMPRQVGIRITDHGIGMSADQLARICERFYRADTSGKIPGTGLGMSIVKEIIELHGGHVSISSEPQEGTTVTLWLPSAG